ncbi:hypothetical protein CIHG_10588 [Coccidioides immitis H538.4]|uniref:Uncharacterized protein n=1 Tax=Coccidioides immitis H538.4 TaxID=396776 RepID=A0A0P6Q2Y9_COCIT|nr:hypothetical protein CIHG_10588 [Coccidioides immitis H538.4]
MPRRLTATLFHSDSMLSSYSSWPRRVAREDQGAPAFADPAAFSESWRILLQKLSPGTSRSQRVCYYNHPGLMDGSSGCGRDMGLYSAYVEGRLDLKLRVAP